MSCPSTSLRVFRTLHGCGAAESLLSSTSRGGTRVVCSNHDRRLATTPTEGSSSVRDRVRKDFLIGKFLRNRPKACQAN